MRRFDSDPRLHCQLRVQQGVKVYWVHTGIRFTERHLLDLQQMLAANGELPCAASKPVTNM